MSQAIELTVGEFVALLNQTLEFAYPSVTIVGELANFRVSKNRWVHFDLKDDEAMQRFFGTVYNLPGPLEDGMLLKVTGSPRMHPQYGFSVTVQSITPHGEGSIKKAASLLEAKLAAEGLFEPERKRALPYPPERVGLIASSESAAYTDFLKILEARWGGLTIELIDVQVQGEAAAEQVVQAIARFNALPNPPEVLILTRGGGSAEDLQAFSTEQVTRVVAASRIPTLVAIGHERDISLAELAADQRASTPSNAAELLVPNKVQVLEWFMTVRANLERDVTDFFLQTRTQLAEQRSELAEAIEQILARSQEKLQLSGQLLHVLDPQAPLSRGYALVQSGGALIRSAKDLKTGQSIKLRLRGGSADASITSINLTN